ncbi:hypothetical protein BDZ91DRAFT_244319 [Kalaharituber pfeilii]|nr:hypothetical protein BDZ91DRAFT_244319 [Kalaharituber pfeilii]
MLYSTSAPRYSYAGCTASRSYARDPEAPPMRFQVRPGRDSRSEWFMKRLMIAAGSGYVETAASSSVSSVSEDGIMDVDSGSINTGTTSMMTFGLMQTVPSAPATNTTTLSASTSISNSSIAAISRTLECLTISIPTVPIHIPTNNAVATPTTPTITTTFSTSAFPAPPLTPPRPPSPQLQNHPSCLSSPPTLPPHAPSPGPPPPPPALPHHQYPPRGSSNPRARSPYMHAGAHWGARG